MMSAARIVHTNSTPKYRSAEIQDGKVVLVQESRRRTHVIRSSSSSSSDQSRQSLRAVHNSPALRSVSPIDFTTARCSVPSREVSRNGSHVTQSKPKGTVVVVQAPAPIKPARKEDRPFVKGYALPSPPPTPKIGRLSTPDLPDLDEAPFCDCCVDAHVIKYCASCGCDIKRGLF